MQRQNQRAREPSTLEPGATVLPKTGVQGGQNDTLAIRKRGEETLVGLSQPRTARSIAQPFSDQFLSAQWSYPIHPPDDEPRPTDCLGDRATLVVDHRRVWPRVDECALIDVARLPALRAQQPDRARRLYATPPLCQDRDGIGRIVNRHQRHIDCIVHVLYLQSRTTDPLEHAPAEHFIERPCIVVEDNTIPQLA